MNRDNRKAVDRGFDLSVEEAPEVYAWNEWLVYGDYAVDEEGGCRYVRALDAERADRTKPLARPSASLFLEFARWPEEEGMDLRPRDSDKNAEAALKWARIFGVLGVAPPDFALWGSSSEVLRELLGGHAPGMRRSRGVYNDGRGGPGETVDRFAVEAWKANTALRLYEAATKPGGPDVNTIVGYMPDRKDGWEDLPTARELYGGRPETALRWALSLVEEMVEGEVRGRCWPIPVRRGDDSYGQGWAFDSLLGAMWLQMLWLMRGRARRCDWCGALLGVDPEQTEKSETGKNDASRGGRRKPPSHRRFCPGTTCRQKWNYYCGTGKSSKAEKKRQRELRQRREGN